VTLARVRVTAVSSVGAATTLSLLSNGSGYNTSTGVATTSLTGFRVDNEDDFNAESNLPEVIAKYPGSFGNNIGLGIVRASEFYGWQFQNRFVVAPESDSLFFDGDRATSTFTLTSALSTASDLVVTMSNAELEAGAAAGNYSITGTTLTVIGDSETFTGDELTYQFTIANASNLDLFSSVVTVDGTELTSQFDGTGEVPAGYFDIDPTSGLLTVGTTLNTFSGNGATLTFSATTTDTLTVTNTAVNVNGTAYTLSAAAPNAGEVQIQAIVGGYSFTFNAAEAPAAGLNNIEIRFGAPTSTASNVVVSYGLPNGTDALKVFANQTEVHAVVYDQDGTLTGSTNGIIEAYGFLSTDTTAKNPDGTTNYYVSVLNNNSDYVWLGNTMSHWGDKPLSNGVDDYTVTSGEYQTSFNEFRNSDVIDVTYVIDPIEDIALTVYLKALCEDRGDCVVFTSPLLSQVVNNTGSESDSVIEYFSTGLGSSSYVHVSTGWQYRYDRYNDLYRWVPLSGADAGGYAAAHYNVNRWSVAAGVRRGQYQNAIKLAWTPNEAERDALYANGINPSITRAGEGHYLFGSKTYQTARNDAFTRMNVRFLFIYAKKQMAEAVRPFLFEINDEITRSRVRNVLAPFLRSLQGDRGVYEYKLVVDDTNNTSAVIDQNVLAIDVFMKPTKVIDYIELRLVATSTGISFSEIIGNI